MLIEGIAVKIVVFLNKWSDLFHLLLMRMDGEKGRRLDSRYTRSSSDLRTVWATASCSVLIEDANSSSFVASLFAVFFAIASLQMQFMLRVLIRGRHHGPGPAGSERHPGCPTFPRTGG